MSSNEKVKFRSIPNQESDRPLSTYDNLNNGDTKTNGSTTPTPATSENECIERCENANEFPFTGISFRFDELKQLQQQQQQPNTAPIIHTSNGYDNVTNNNYKLHRSSNSNSNGNTNNNHHNNHHNHNHNDHPVTHADSTHFNGNGVNRMRNSQGHNIVTTIAQNHSSSAPLSPSPTSSASSSSNSSSPASSSSSTSSSLSVNNYKQSSLQYSNLAENPIANRGSFSKPVHSPAKSQFLGLHKPSNEIEYATETDGKVTNGSGAVKKQNSEKNALDEVDAISDEEPLLNNYGNSRIRVMANGGSTTSQYQNVPSNSSCYGQNQIDNANECTCTCSKSSDSTNEIQQYESDRYKCNGCQTAQQQQQQPISVIPIATMNVPSCSKTVDLSSCTTSMKPAKSTPLDTSPSFRMNQSSLSQVKTTFVIVSAVELINSFVTLTLTLNSFVSFDESIAIDLSTHLTS